METGSDEIAQRLASAGLSSKYDRRVGAGALYGSLRVARHCRLAAAMGRWVTAATTHRYNFASVTPGLAAVTYIKMVYPPLVALGAKGQGAQPHGAP